MVASRGKNAVFEDQRESAGGDEGAWRRGPAYADDPAENDQERPDDGGCGGGLEPPEQRHSDSTGSGVIRHTAQGAARSSDLAFVHAWSTKLLEMARSPASALSARPRGLHRHSAGRGRRGCVRTGSGRTGRAAHPWSSWHSCWPPWSPSMRSAGERSLLFAVSSCAESCRALHDLPRRYGAWDGRHSTSGVTTSPASNR